MANIEHLQLGSTIRIGRSDGRIHDAIVTVINYDHNTVSVEWKESDEIKGKDIDFKTLTHMNPNLIPVRPIQSNTSLYEKKRVKSSKSRITEERKFSRSSRSLTETSPNCRSRVLKNVGKIETDRLERRKKLVEMKAEKDVISRKIADNPNFELLTMIEEYRKKVDNLPMTTFVNPEDRLITVCVRKRPLNKYEISKKEVDIVTIPSMNQLVIHEPKAKVNLTKYLENHTFKFDYTFNEACSNKIIYKYTAEPLIKTIFEGGFATCFAYGQTGSGKTYTMSGDFDRNIQGIYAMVATDIFNLVKSKKYQSLRLTVTCSFFEIYSKKVLDLLNNKGTLKILEDGKQQVQIVGLIEKVVRSVGDVLNLIQLGNTARTSGHTSANLNSSRSHAVFQINLRKLGTIPDNLHGKISLIDLAGNERGADTLSSDKVTRLEGGEINKSLLALKECIRALGRKGAHLPFRLSKLTQVLRDSFVGNNSRTCMIAMISPGVNSCENTLNTLRYADRVKELGGNDLQQLKTITEKRNYDSEDIQTEIGVSNNTTNDSSVDFVSFHAEFVEVLENAVDDSKKLSKCVVVDSVNYCNKFEQIANYLQSFLLDAKNFIAQNKHQ